MNKNARLASDLVSIGARRGVLGIAGSGLAGMSKEKELSPEQKKATVKEFNFRKGMLVATFAGIMSSCFAYGLAAGKPLGELAKTSLVTHRRSDIWQNLPVLIIVLAGGFTTNFIWCVILNFRNRTSHEYLNLRLGVAAQPGPAPLLNNYLFAALAGVTWYLQFFFYSMGSTKMGKYDFSSWTLHMASIIIFSTLWGISLKEWNGSSRRTYRWLVAGLALLILSTCIVGYGNFLSTHP